jgi:peptidoglycan hydrolase-like amidase/tetratricopeptide (TPR) repeat protein
MHPENEPAGRYAFYQGDYATAEQQYRWLLEKRPGDQDTVRDLAAVLMAAGKYREAVDCLKQAGIQGLELGEALIAAGELNEAADELKETLTQPGSHTQAWTLLGFLGSLQARYPDAVQYYWQALDENPKQASVHLWLARAFEAMGNTPTAEHAYFEQRAREEYQAALRVDASLWQVYRDLAVLAERGSHWGEALQRWQRVRAVAGDSPEIREAVARLKSHGPEPTATPAPPKAVISSGPPSPRFHELTVKSLGHPGDPVIHVGLGVNLPSVAFGCMGEWRAFDKKGKHFWKGQANKSYRIEQDPSGGWILKSWDRRLLKSFNKQITIEPLDPQKPMVVFNLYQTDGYLWSSGWRANYYYRGQLVVAPKGRHLTLMNWLFLEDYLVSVVPGEMEASWPMEALKAQAVVARTDVLGRRGTHASQGFDICTSAHCAYYQGVEAENPRTQEAVCATRDEILMHNGRLSTAFYTHACGGMLQGSQEAWGKQDCDPSKPAGLYDWEGDSRPARSLPLHPGEIGPWLAERPEVFCGNLLYSGEHSFRWFKLLSREELSTILNRRYGVGQVQQMRVLERSPSAYVRKIYVQGDQGEVTLQGDPIRSALGGLRSNLFMFIPIPAPASAASADPAPLAWLIWGGGWGHGVGLCQAGAAEMGRQGYVYQEIIHHYFPEAELQTWH